MKVHQIMRSNVRTCYVFSSLAAAAAKMWESDAGALPVVDENGHVVGIITDRDIAIALGTRDRPAAYVGVTEVMSRDVLTCAPDDDIRAALERMAERKVRRLPVVDGGGTLKGILSVDDLALRSDGGPLTDLTYADVGWVLRAICDARRPKLSARSSSGSGLGRAG